ncbi:sugar kinase [Luteimonas panaciterrae]|uniref:sugar kinase n=1 Tax=Luteimonas panaciterrae TaxID=363885 RepID=UPI001CF9FA9A|nr:sugar kinase [Luteimonas panaciterrae]
MPKSILCFGELLLRLGAPGRERLLQTPHLEVHVGGAEANVAVALARLGHAAAVVSVVSDNPLGAAVVGELRRHGVDTSRVRTGAGRQGLYFLATGALQRPSEVLYDRAHSAFALAPAESYDWPSLLTSVDALHVSGVTPALGSACADATLSAARAARKLGLHVSFDGNFRQKLWAERREQAPAVLRAIIAEADIALADHRDIAIALELTPNGKAATEVFVDAARAAFDAFPHLRRLATTLRTQHSVDHHSLTALMATRDGALLTAPAYSLSAIVDRIGAGDAFAAGVLHGLYTDMSDQAALHFGLASACLKHSQPGDFSLSDKAEIAAVVAERGFDVRR